MSEKKLPIEIVVIVPSYNNEKWCIESLATITNQTYPHFSIYYIDDCSTDDTGALVDEYVKTHHLESMCTIIHNKERKGSLANIYETVHQTAPHKVIVLCDGDDTLAHEGVLEIVAQAYETEDIWVTFSSMRLSSGEMPNTTPIDVALKQNIPLRLQDKWVVNVQLYSFYAKLFQLIQKEELQFGGEFFPMTGDLAFMLPMFEMASRNHYKTFSETLYIYNIFNPISDFRTDRTKQLEFEKHVRALPAYEPLEKLFP